MSKTAVITGGNGNTGYEIALKFASEGYNVVITSRDERIVDTAAKLKEKFPQIETMGLSLELTSVESIKLAFGRIKEKFGKIDCFVANAAHLGVDLDSYNTTEEDFDAVFNTNVKGSFFSCREAARLMPDGGAIVTLGSVQSKGAVEGRTIYGASKAALATLTRYMAFDFAPHNIRANCVIAGAIHTNRWDELPAEVVAKRRSNYPLKKEASGQDIANAVFYFATPLSNSTTGTELVVDSGLTINLLPYPSRKVVDHSDFFKE